MYAKEPFLDQAIFLPMMSGFGQTGWWWIDSLATARCAEFVDTPGEALEGRNGGDCLEGDMVRVSEEIIDVHVVAGGIHVSRSRQGPGVGEGANSDHWCLDAWASGCLGRRVSGYLWSGITGTKTGRASTWRLRGCTGGI
jgi:hypothetical protein